jgi:hypothetical protein
MKILLIVAVLLSSCYCFAQDNGPFSDMSDSAARIMIYNDMRKRQAAENLSDALKDFANALEVTRRQSDCFLIRSYISGMNQVCIYNCISGDVAITIDAMNLCPLSIRN